MKKSLFFLITPIAFGGVILTSCGAGSQSSPEEEVRNYGKYFIEKLSANQLDSLQTSYPDIAKAESLVPIKSDSILVKETAPGQFDMTLAEGITLKVTRSEDGKISVIESKGLFAFPEDKVELAKKTGMWDDNLSDAKLNERMKDDEFFKYLKDQIKTKTTNIIQIGQFHYSSEVDDIMKDSAIPAPGEQILTNLSDIPLDGSEYTIIREEYYCAQGIDESEIVTEKGRAIPSKGSIKIKGEQSSRSGNPVKSIKWKLTPEQLQEKFASFTGKEYQEYLDSKK